MKVNEILRKNLQVIEKIYKRSEGTIITHAKKRYLTLPELKAYMHEMNLKPPISEFNVGAIFYESLLCITDTIRTKRMEEMQPWEFLVFICRITFEYYKNTVYKSELMYVKLEKLLPIWLAPVQQVSQFEFHVDFEHDKKMAKRKLRLERRAAGFESDDDDDDDSDDDDSSENEVAAAPIVDLKINTEKTEEREEIGGQIQR